jgi:hypothetical protein
VPLSIDEAIYDAGAAEVAVRVNSPYSLPEDQYRFFACAAIEDLTSDPLDGNGDGTGGDDYAIDFDVIHGSNHLVNPNLDLDLAGWSGGGFSHDPLVDVDGAAASGSAAGSVTGTGDAIEIRQCVDLTGLDGELIDVEGWYRLVQNGTGNPNTWIIIAFFDVADCSGPETRLVPISVTGDTGGAWEKIALKQVMIPLGTLSADIHFVVIGSSSPDAEVDVDANFDLLTSATRYR